MEKQEFYQELKRLTEQILGEGCKISLHQVQEPGHGSMEAFIMEKKNQAVLPAIYPQDYYTRFEQGEGLPVLAEDMAAEYVQCIHTQKRMVLDMEFLNRKEQMEQNLFFRCMNSQEKNQGILRDLPHRNILNLSVVYSVLVSCTEDSISFFTVTEEIRKRHGWTESSMFQLSMENTRRLFPERVQPIEEVLSGMGFPDGCRWKHIGEERNPENKNRELVMVSNASFQYGFSAIFYPGVLPQLAEEAGGNLIIIPSSIHEALVLADHGRIEPEEINQMIMEVNDTQVAEKEQLSDKAYYYNRETERLYFMEDSRKGEQGVCVKF